jgi:formate dehydrogenase subunit gamma
VKEERMNNATQQARFRRRLRQYALAFMVMAVMVVAAPFSGLLLLDATAEQGFVNGDNPRSEYWREVRQGESGYTAVQGKETGTLIQNGGQNWRALRNGPLANYGGWLLGVLLVALLAYYLIHGQVRLEHGRSGRTVTRWSMLERVLHWLTTITFLVLAVTGLSLLFGRAVLIPVIGKEAFAAYAALAKDAHNYLGPVFGVCLVLFLIKLLPYNIPAKHDLEWFKRGGGMFGGKEPSAGRMNAGEKSWFWTLSTLGIALVVSGLFLDFPVFGLDREGLQWSHLVHGITAFLVIAFSFLHMYLGTIGNEGAFEGMVNGEVDVNWVIQHHDLWHEELKHQSSGSGADASLSGEGAAPRTG